MTTLLQLAGLPGLSGSSVSARPLWLYLLIAGSGLLLLSGIGLFLWWLFVYRKRAAAQQGQPVSGQTTHPSRGIDKKRLSSIWERFLSHLPSSVQTTLPEHSHFIIMGAAGAGKSTLIDRKVDWQGQASQFLPSYTADPLLQIYLGSNTVVHEMAAPLLDSTSGATGVALKRLFRKLDINQPPTVLLVLKGSSLATATPDQIEKQAQLMRGKINLISESFNVPIPTRICVTHMDRTRGYGDMARFLRRNKIALELPIGADASLSNSLQSYEKHLPRALTTLPVAAFQSTVGFLLSAEDVVGPVRSFIQGLLAGSLSAARPELEKLYFFSPAPDEQVGNPLDTPGTRPAKLRSLSWLRRWFALLGIEPLHAAIGGALLLAGLVALGIVTRRHAALVRTQEATTATFEAAVHRAQEAHIVPSESEAVRTAERNAGLAINAVYNSEARFRPLRILFRPEKASTRLSFANSVRDGYFLPELDRAVRQRSRERILYVLVAIYATNQNSLGALVRAQPVEWSTVTLVPVDVLTDYLRASEEPWHGMALRLLPTLPSENSRWPVNDLKPWREFAGAILAALPQPYIANSQLKELQKDSEHLLDTLAQVKKAAILRQIFQALREESPLDMVRLFGRDAGALTPHPFIVDHKETLERLLTLVRDSSLQLSSGGRMSLFRLLKWINELNAGGANMSLASTSGSELANLPNLEEEIYHLPFPDERPLEISRRAWLELLLRSRKRLLLSRNVNAITGSTPAKRQRGHGHRYRYSETSGDTDTSATSAGTGFDSSPGTDSSSHASEAATSQPPARKRKRHSGDVCQPKSADNDDAEDEPRRKRRHHGSDPGSRGNLWSKDELAPKLATLLASDTPPENEIGDLYNRVLFEKEVRPLLQELKKALGGSKNLSPEEKLRLSQVVKNELATYSRRYCTALTRYYLSYRFRAYGASLHSELLNLVNPGSPFLSHLRTVADNMMLEGLDDPYLRGLAQCLSVLQPVAALVYPELGQKELTAVKPQKDRPGGFPEPMLPYKDAVNKLVAELETGPQQKESNGGTTSPLAERLGPLGKTALAAAEAHNDTPLRLAEKFLDTAGVAGELRRPFLSPFQHAYRQGISEMETAMAQHWRDDLLPQVTPLFSRFPFSRNAEREVAISELDLLNEQKGAFFQDLRTFYAPVLSERSGTYQQKQLPVGSVDLPPNMLTTVNRLAQLSRALFRSDGSRQSLKLSIRGLPGRVIQERATAPTLAFLQVGKAAAYGFNQQPAAMPIAIDWWSQGVAMVGIESTTASTGRRQTQSLEVADSAWSLFRLLQKSTLDRDGVSTWRILGDTSAETQLVRFIVEPDPWALFSVQLP